MAAGFFRRGDNLLVGGVRTAEFDIVLNRVCEEIYVLEYHTDLLHEGFQRILPDICATDTDGAAVHIPEPGDQTAQSGLSGTAGTYDGSCSAVRYRYAYVFQDWSFIVRKVHMIERDVMLFRRYRPSCAVHFRDLVNLIRMVDGTSDDTQQGYRASC